MTQIAYVTSIHLRAGNIKFGSSFECFLKAWHGLNNHGPIQLYVAYNRLAHFIFDQITNLLPMDIDS